ncbi:MAG: cyclic nucleotide-binding domain-containing protein [Chlamydiota bacterium]
MDALLSKIAVLREVKLFKDLTLDVLQEIAHKIQRRKITRGEVIFTEGDVPYGLYIISLGEVAIQKGKTRLAVLKEHDFFGEGGLLNNDPRSATATAESDCVLLYLDNETFNSLIVSYPEILSMVIHKVIHDLEESDDPGRFLKSQNFYESVIAKNEAITSKTLNDQPAEVKEVFEIIRKAPLFKGLPDNALLPFAKTTKWKKAKKGEVIFSKGDESDYMYVISKGSVFIKKGNKEISLLNGHDFFGEAGIATNQPRMASAIAVEDSIFLQISKESFKEIISNYPSIARSVLFKIVSYHYPNYQLQDQDTLFQIEKLLPKPSHTLLDPQLFFESLGLTKSKAITVLDLYQVVKSDLTYHISEIGLQQDETNKPPAINKTKETPPSDTPLNHIEIEGIWDEKGKFVTNWTCLEIPVMEATEDSLAYYGAKVLSTGEAFKFTEENFPIWNVMIGEEYLNNFIMTEKGGGISLECQMDKPHFLMPANSQAHGYYILAKRILPNDPLEKKSKYRFTAFKIPYGKALYIYPGAIHCDTALQGNWLIGCANAKKSSSVVMRTQEDKMVTLHFTSSSLIQKNVFISIYGDKEP